MRSTQIQDRSTGIVRTGRARWLLVPLGAAFVAILVGAHYWFLTTPTRYANRDFMSLWCGGRAILEGLDPYDPQVWVPLRRRFGSTWMPDDRAPFPLWTLMFSTPFALLSLDWGAAAWLVLTEWLLGLSVFLLVTRLEGQKPSLVAFACMALGAFTLRGTLTTLNNGQITFVLLLVLTLFLVLSRRRKPFLAGFVLAFILFKPTPFTLFAPLVGLWLISRRRWKTLLGGLAGGTALLATSWLLQPGWLFEWLKVRGKTEVTFKTPTIWGVAYELSPAWWPLLGMGMAIALTAALGWLVLAQGGRAGRELDETHVVSLALSGSLLVTPYAWAYEHALLLVPLLLLFARLNLDRRGCAWLVWGSLTWGLPWLLYWVAIQLDRDTMSFFVPVAVGVAFYALGCSAPQTQEEPN